MTVLLEHAKVGFWHEHITLIIATVEIYFGNVHCSFFFPLLDSIIIHHLSNLFAIDVVSRGSDEEISRKQKWNEEKEYEWNGKD